MDVRPQPRSSGPSNRGITPDQSVDTLANARTRLRDLPGKKGGAPIRDKGTRLEFNIFNEFLFQLARATLIGAIPAAIAIGTTLTMFVMSVVPPINTARSDVLNREVEFQSALAGSQPVLSELEQLGAPSDQIQIVYFAFTDSKGDERRRMADTYLGVLTDQAIDAQVRRGAAAQRIPVLLGPPNTARRKLAAAYKTWSELLETPRGKMALWLGLVHEPEMGMAVYERSHPR